jgi:glutaredoxin 3
MAARVKLYTRRWCGYCVAAERLLAQKGIAFEQIDTTGDPALRKWLLGATGRSTVPQIFIDDAPIGGYDDLRSLERSGRLDALLSGSPA